MNSMGNYNYACLNDEQKNILKEAEEEINEMSDEKVLLMAFENKVDK